MARSLLASGEVRISSVVWDRTSKAIKLASVDRQLALPRSPLPATIHCVRGVTWRFIHFFVSGVLRYMYMVERYFSAVFGAAVLAPISHLWNLVPAFFTTLKKFFWYIITAKFSSILPGLNLRRCILVTVRYSTVLLFPTAVTHSPALSCIHETENVTQPTAVRTVDTMACRTDHIERQIICWIIYSRGPISTHRPTLRLGAAFWRCTEHKLPVPRFCCAIVPIGRITGFACPVRLSVCSIRSANRWTKMLQVINMGVNVHYERSN